MRIARLRPMDDYLHSRSFWRRHSDVKGCSVGSCSASGRAYRCFALPFLNQCAVNEIYSPLLLATEGMAEQSELQATGPCRAARRGKGTASEIMGHPGTEAIPTGLINASWWVGTKERVTDLRWCSLDSVRPNWAPSESPRYFSKAPSMMAHPDPSNFAQMLSHTALAHEVQQDPFRQAGLRRAACSEDLV